MNDADYMREALLLADVAEARGEVPVGALVVMDGVVIGRGSNQPINTHDPTAHAEVIALRDAAAARGNYRLPGATLYVTLEPCAMCAGAISLARVARLVYAAADPKGGAVEHGPQFFRQLTCHHRTSVARAGDELAAGRLLTEFFRARRK